MANTNAGGVSIAIHLDAGSVAAQAKAAAQTAATAFGAAFSKSQAIKINFAGLDTAKKQVAALNQELGKVAINATKIANAMSKVNTATGKTAQANAGMGTVKAQQASYKQLIADINRAAAAREKADKKQIADQQKINDGLKKQIAEIKKLNEATSKKKQESSKGGGGLLPGLSQAAFGGSLMKAGNPISGLTMMTQGLSKAMGAVGVSSSIMVGAIVAIAAAAVAAYTVVKKLGEVFLDFVKTGIQSAIELETVAVGLETLTGSAEEAQAEFQEISKIAIRSPFNVEDVANVDRFLATIKGIGPTIRRDLTQSITDVAAAFGFGADRAELIGFAIAQISAAGKVTGDEMRQLRNQMIPVLEVMKALPKYANMSSAEIKKLVEEGAISSREFNAAFVQYSKAFEGAAQKQADTVKGLMQNIKEALTISVGTAIGPETLGGVDALAPVRDILMAIRSLVQTIDWGPFAQALKNAFSGIKESANIYSAFDGVQKFLEVTLPNMMNQIGAAIGPTLSVIGIAFQTTFGTMFGAFSEGESELAGFTNLLTALEVVVKSLATVWIAGFNAMKIVMEIMFAPLKLIIQGVLAVYNGFLGLVKLIAGPIGSIIGVFNDDLGTAINEWSDDSGKHLAEMGSNLKALGTDTVDTFLAIKDAGIDAFVGIKDTWDQDFVAPAAIAKKKKEEIDTRIIDTIKDLRTDLDAQYEEIDAILKEQEERAKQDHIELLNAMKAEAERITELWKTLVDITRTWNGQRSELVSTMFGDEGDFTADLSAIRQMGQTMSDTFRELGRMDMVGYIDRQTRALLDLARQRERVAKELEKAEQRLTDALNERNRLIVSVTESTKAFVNAAKQQEEVFTEIIKTSTGWIAIERKRTKGLVQGMQEALNAVKAWTQNIQTLRTKGLDPDFLLELITGGIEQNGAKVAELVLGGDAMIQEVNRLQGELKYQAAMLGLGVGVSFKQAGVDIAQAEVDGLKSKQQAITNQAFYIVGEMQRLVAPMAQAGYAAGKAWGDWLLYAIKQASAEAVRVLNETQLRLLQQRQQFENITAQMDQVAALLKNALAVQQQNLNASPRDEARLQDRIAFLRRLLDQLRYAYISMAQGYSTAGISGYSTTPASATPAAVTPAPAPVTMAAPTIVVQIGNETIKGIARTEVRNENTRTVRRVALGQGGRV